MKITANHGPNHWAFFFRNPPEIFLDDEPVAEVLEADDEVGYTISLKMNGAYPVHAGGEYLTEKKTGKVEIRGDRL